MKKAKVAVQLYSVREDLEKDFYGVLKQVKEMGYAGVEFAGFYDQPADKVKAALDDLGLTAVSSHVPLDALNGDVDSIIAYHKTLGCDFMAIPWLDEPRRPGTDKWPEVVSQVKAIGKAAKAAGIQLLYHNHDFEFLKIDGEYALDRLYGSIPADLLATEVDTCWVSVAGENPAAYLRKYADRSPVVHLKDFIKEGDADNMYALIDEKGKDDTTAVVDRSTFDFRPLGLGQLALEEILKAVDDIGSEWIVVEQDRSTERPPMEAIKISRETLAKLGY